MNQNRSFPENEWKYITIKLWSQNETLAEGFLHPLYENYSRMQEERTAIIVNANLNETERYLIVNIGNKSMRWPGRGRWQSSHSRYLYVDHHFSIVSRCGLVHETIRRGQVDGYSDLLWNYRQFTCTIHLVAFCDLQHRTRSKSADRHPCAPIAVDEPRLLHFLFGNIFHFQIDLD